MVNLQRRHFCFIADVLNDLKGNIDDDAHQKVVDHFCSKLRSTNYLFNSGRFYDRARGVVTVRPSKRVRRVGSRIPALAPTKEESDGGYWE